MHLLVMPNVILQSYLQSCHNKLHHPSSVMLFQYVKTKIYHQHLRTECINTEQSCFTCATVNCTVKSTKRSGNIRKYESTEPRQAYSCDIISGLPKTKMGFTAFLIVCDIHSKYVSAYLLKDKSQAEITRAFFSLLSAYGPPKLIMADNDISIISPLKYIQQTCYENYFSEAHQNLI